MFVPEVRDNPVAMTLFGIGLIALAGAGVAAALDWRRTQIRESAHGRVAGALLPLAVVSALFLPQFFLPPAGRIAYGLLFAMAAAYTAYALVTSEDEPATSDLTTVQGADRAVPPTG